MKKIPILLLVMCFLLTLITSSFAYSATDMAVTLNGKTIEWENSAVPYTDGSEIMLPLKKITSVLGCSYQEIETQNQQRKIVNLNKKILLVIVGSREYAVTDLIEKDGKYTYGESKSYLIDKALTQKNGDVFFPLSHFCSAFGMAVQKTAASVNFSTLSAAENNSAGEDTSLEKINGFYKEKKYSDCILECDKMLSKDDTLMEAYYFKSMSYFHSNDLQNAYETLIKQLSKNPKNQLALYNGACAASLLNKEQEAVDLIERLLVLDITEKSVIIGDKDFDNIRNNEKYKKLMETSVVFGGELLFFDVAPIIVEGRTLLPLRKVFETFGAEVSFDDATQTVTAENGSFSLSLVIGNTKAIVNGIEKTLDVPAMIINDRTLVPIRFVGESLNAKVDWDDKNQVVSILTSPPIGNSDYEAVKKQLDETAVVSVIDGGWAEPYSMSITEGMSLIIFKDKKGLELFNGLSLENRSKYVSDTVYENYALVVGCSPVYAKVIYDGKVFYEGNFDYNVRNELPLTYYEKGKPVNVVKQYKKGNNYKDFYMLPLSEQTTSRMEDATEKEAETQNSDIQKDVDISTARETVTLDGIKCSLQATMACMDLAELEEGFPLMAGISILNDKSDNITPDMYIGRIWIIHESEIEQGIINEKNNAVDHAYRFFAKWKAGSFVDIVVEITNSKGSTGLVKASKVKIRTLEESLQDLLGPGVKIEIN